MTMYQFDEIFEQYNIAVKRHRKAAGYRDYNNGGQWVDGAETTIDMTAIVIPLSREDLRFDEGGRYTRQDRKIIVQKPQELSENDFVSVRGVKYRVMEKLPYADDYADFDIFVAKRTDMEGGN